MERRLKILFLALVYIILSGKSCVDDSSHITWQEKQAEMAIDSIRFEFEVDALSAQSLYAAEISAIQKLKDLEGYLEIFTDVSLDTMFREKAGEMIRKMFMSKDVRLSFSQMKNKKMKSVSLDEFLKTGFEVDIRKAEVMFDTIRILEPLKKSDESTYSGKLAAFQSIILHSSADSTISPAIPVTIDFISSKQVKIIGQDTLKVWEVNLGDMDF